MKIGGLYDYLKYKRQFRPVTEGEVARIIAACSNGREKAIISLLAYSGVRASPAFKARDDGTFSVVLQSSVEKLPKREENQ